jgi:hypothetical protein
VRDPDDDRLDALALDLMQRARVADLKADADQLSELLRGLEPSPDFLPPLSDNRNERETELLTLLLRERERSRRLLALLSGKT